MWRCGRAKGIRHVPPMISDPDSPSQPKTVPHRASVAPGSWWVVISVLLAAALGLSALAGSMRLSEQLRLRGMLTVEAVAPMRSPAAVLPTAAGGAAGRPVLLRVRNTTASLAKTFRKLGYQLAAVRASGEVPRLFLSELPRDFDEIGSVERRKSLFLRSLLPLVLRENERLLAQRERLQRLQQKLDGGEEPTPAERAWLAERYGHFGVQPGRSAELLRRVDVVPPSLALAQAATESGWGTSRFAREGNALFGQWTWSDDVPGMVPRERDGDATHRVRAFGSLDASVRAYMHTLNTHRAYRDLRAHREALRRKGRTPGGLALAGGVSRYSEERGDYTARLRRVIRGNDLHALDGTSLGHAWSGATAQAAGRGLLSGPALIAQEPGR